MDSSFKPREAKKGTGDNVPGGVWGRPHRNPNFQKNIVSEQTAKQSTIETTSLGKACF